MYNKSLVWILLKFFILSGYISVGSHLDDKSISPDLIIRVKQLTVTNTPYILQDNGDVEESHNTENQYKTEEIYSPNIQTFHGTKGNIDREYQNDGTTANFIEEQKDHGDEVTKQLNSRSLDLGRFDGCNDHGSCYRHGKDFSCCCHAGYTGRQCEFEIISTSPSIISTPPSTYVIGSAVITSSALSAATQPSPPSTYVIGSAEITYSALSAATQPSPMPRPTCAPVNNCSAHITCTNDGVKKCLPGWTGEDCDRLVPNSLSDCTIYNYDNDFISSEWNGTYSCGVAKTNYLLNVYASNSDLKASFITDQFSVSMTGNYRSSNKLLVLTSGIPIKITGSDLSGLTLSMNLNSSLVMTGVVRIYGDDDQYTDCNSDLQRTAAHFDGCHYQGECYRYGGNKNDFACCCHKGFYGLFCEKKYTPTSSTATPNVCVPVNNCSAHYTCNFDGSKKCLDGWSGEECNQLIQNSVADCSYYDFGKYTTTVESVYNTDVKFSPASGQPVVASREIQNCGTVPLQPNATASYSLVDGVQHVNITCDDKGTGHVVQDNMYCDNGTWTIDKNPQCIQGFTLITHPPYPQTKPTYRPTINPRPSNGSKEFLCPPILYIDNGNVTQVGIITSFTCAPGHNLLGSASLQCEDGGWNDSVPICSECRMLRNPLNGRVEYTSGQTFDIARFNCDTGYDLTGEEAAYCLNGVWSSQTLPACTFSAYTCSVLDHIENGEVQSSSNGSLVVYQCNKGYNIVGTVVRYCNNGSWTDEEPFCRITDCGQPAVIDNGEVATLGGTTYGSLAVYTCKAGYYTNETKSRVCKENGSWSNIIPTCRVIDCGNLTDPVNGSVQYQSTVDMQTGYDSLAIYNCFAGFSLVGFTSRVCLARGNWSGKPPRCVKTNQNAKPCLRNIDSWGTVWSDALPGQTISIHCKGQNIKDSTNVAWEYERAENALFNTHGIFGSNATFFLLSAAKIFVPTIRGTWPEYPVVVTTITGTTKGIFCEVSRHCSMSGEWGLPLYSCVRRDISNIYEQIEELHTNPSSFGVSYTLGQLANVTSATDGVGELHAGELETITESLDTIATISDSAILINEEQSQVYIKTASNLFDQRHARSWQALSQSEDPRGVSRVLQSIDRFSEAVTRALEHGNRTQLSIVQSNIVMQVKKISAGEQAITFPDSSSTPDWIQDSKSGLTLALPSSTGFPVKSYTGVFYRNLVSIFPNRSLTSNNNSYLDSNKKLNSPVLSLQLFPEQNNLSRPLELTFNHQKPNFRNATCSYWNFESNLWETEGCRIKASQQSVTVCECYHLTNFAVLMSPWNTESEDSTIIEVISIAGCCVSIVCLLIILTAHFVVWRYVKSDRVIILMNLCLALTASYIIFLAGVNQIQNKNACTAVAAMLQYIYLAVFFLMLAEGIEIAVTVLYVFSTKSRIKWILPAAWGVPAVIVGISLGVTKLEGYGTKDFCWLSVENGLIWSFVGPAVFIILVNAILLILVIRAMLSSKAVSEKTDTEKLKCSLRCLCVLLPLMGCTWVLGIFYVNERMVWIQYLFAICNSLQGFFIFLFHGFLNKQAVDTHQDYVVQAKLQLNACTSGHILKTAFTKITALAYFLGQLRTAIKRRQKKYKDSATTSKEFSSRPREPNREKPLFQANQPCSEPVHLVSYERRRSQQMGKRNI